VITVALSATIGASRKRVWHALVDPSERVLWDERILGEIASPRAQDGARQRRRASNQPASPLRLTRWRFKLGSVPLVMREEIVTADPIERLTSRISIGSIHLDQTLTLYSEDNETGPRTRLGMKVIASNSIAVIGEVVPRAEVQRLAIEYVDSTLRQVQKFCEAEA
jgi:uncharacterized protein YndB with AHSA1/START domain